MSTEKAKSEVSDLAIPDTETASEQYTLGVCDTARELIEALTRVGALIPRVVPFNLPSDPATQTDIAHGNLSIVSAVLCGALIGQGVLDADDLLPGLRRRSEFWRARGCEYRALPAERLAEALVHIAEQKREVDAQIAASRTAATATIARMQ
jgi:hypothetical protein